MSWKAVVAFLIALGIGGVLIFTGATGLSAAPSCGGQTMSRGDVCRETRNGTTTVRNYDEQKGQNQQGNYIAMGLGGLIVVGAIFFTVAGARSRARSRSVTQAIGTG